MVYRAIGLMSGSSLDGLDMAYAELIENAGSWAFEIKECICLSYPGQWEERLKSAANLPAKTYILLHSEYGHFLGNTVMDFITKHNLEHQVSLIASHGHTTFHDPENKYTHQLGDGAAIAAATRLPVVSDLRNVDIAFGGQGAPIVPMGEKLLFPRHNCFLNLGGIANISIHSERPRAFDICPANAVLNRLAALSGSAFDKDGKLAAKGKIYQQLLDKLNEQSYYRLEGPKSLANDFGTYTIYPILSSSGLSQNDLLATFTEHIASQVKESLKKHIELPQKSLFISGGGAFNRFLVERIAAQLEEIGFDIYLPEAEIINFKEALIMALLGVLRWREEFTVDRSVTGATQSSIGGALWLGMDE